MAVRVVNPEPDKSVIKQVICQNCGATLEYVPRDVQSKTVYCMTESESITFIECPQCNTTVEL